MKTLALALLATLAACEQPRTQMMIGVVTDIKAPNLIDGAQLVVTRAKDGFVEQQVSWDISGAPNQPFNLPGSYGIYSDGEEIQLDITLTGTKAGSKVLDRRAVLNLVEGKTLFFRMSLTGGCIAKDDCLQNQSCVEGVCRDVAINPLQLPEFKAEIVNELTCNGGISYIDTATGAPLPLSADADECPANLCLEGTCLKPPPPEEGTRVVTGTQFTSFIQPTKVTNVPTNLSGLVPRAMIPQADGTYITINGTGSADGTFVIPEVPKGKYYLNVGTDYFITNASTFDLTSGVVHRPDVIAPTQTTTINFQNVTGLDPWAMNDELEFFAADADTWMFDSTVNIAPITVGATALTNYAATMQDIANVTGAANLIKNDPFFAMQMQARATPEGNLYKAAHKLYAAPAFTQTDGSTTNLNGTFAPIPQTSMASATFNTTAWDAMIGFNGTNLTALHPMAQEVPGFSFFGLVVHGEPGGPLYGQISATADYLIVNIPHGPNLSLSNMMFGIPALPGSWATIIDVRAGGSVRFLLPGTTTATRISGGVSQTSLFSAATSMFTEPQLGPVRAPRIDNVDLFGTPGPGISTTPTITWQTPSVGKPVQYEVTIHRLTANGATTVRQVVARLFTTDTSVAVPPGILQVGQTYAMQINASKTPNPDAPFRERFPNASATIVTSMFTPTVVGGTGGGGTLVDAGAGMPVPPPMGDAGTGGGGIDAM